MSRFEHLDFDGPPDPPKPKPPAPATGRWERWRERGQPRASRYEVDAGLCSIRVPLKPVALWRPDAGDSSVAKLLVPSVVTVNIDTRWRYGTFAEEIAVELRVQSPSGAWEVTSRTLYTEVLRGINNPVDVMRRMVAPGVDVVLVADPSRNALGMIRVYIERKESDEQVW